MGYALRHGAFDGATPGSDQEAGHELQAGIEVREISDPRRIGRVDRVAPGLLPDRHPPCRDAQDCTATGWPGSRVRAPRSGLPHVCWMLTAPGRQAPGPDVGHHRSSLAPRRRDHHDDGEAALLVSMSAASIDRHLAAERAKLFPRGRSHTKPGPCSSPRSRSAPGRNGARICPDSSKSTWWVTRGQLERRVLLYPHRY